VQYPTPHHQYETQTIPAVVISKVLLPQSNIMAAFVHSHSNIMAAFFHSHSYIMAAFAHSHNIMQPLFTATAISSLKSLQACI
jgi:hypothetical protein